MRKPTKKQQAANALAFTAAMRELLASKGATAGTSYDYVLATPIGPLHLSIYLASMYSGGWIAGRFESHRAARLYCSSNPHSGKWNHHYYDWQITDAVADLDARLTRLLAYVPSDECLRVMREDIAEGERSRAAIQDWLASLEGSKACTR